MESDMTTFHSPLHFPAKSRSIRFLLACLIRKLATKNINKTELILELDQQGMEAHYLNLLYHRKLDESLIRTLFSQCVCPFTVDDCCHYEHIFNELSFGGFPFPVEGQRTYWLKLDPNFRFLWIDNLDDLLGWPRDLSEIFFNYAETHPFAKSLSELTKGLGFDKLNELGSKPYRLMPSKGKSCRKLIKSANYLRLDLTQKPKKCPFCQSAEVVEVSVGKKTSLLKDNEKLNGCCTDPDYLPAAWHCNHCGLPIWKTRDLNAME